MDARKKIIRDYCCPKESIETVEAAKVQILLKAGEGKPIRSFAPKEHTFKCKSCGHDEAYEDPNGSTCKKCKVVQRKVHEGKEWRDIRERTQEKGDLNHCGMKHNTNMSNGFNMSTFMSNRDAKGKKVSAKFQKLAKVQRDMAEMDTIDLQILRAGDVFKDLCDRVDGASADEALALFIRFRTAAPCLRNKHIIYAACMFHTLKHPPKGPVWVRKVFYNKTKFNDSKKKRLKMMTFPKKKRLKTITSKKRPMVLKSYK